MRDVLTRAGPRRRGDPDASPTTRRSATTRSRSRPTSCGPTSRTAVDARRSTTQLGIREAPPQATSVGPTFGQTVANSAIKAIIASLLVISIYIALRFEWKYAVPVLIALMHDLLITAGVYALTRPGGDDVDGRGAADHLGLLALRHDHRVRPRARERPADAARRVLPDRQPLDVRGADAIAGDDVLHAAAGRRAAAVRRRHAQGLRVRAAGRRRVGRLLVDLHRLAGAHALEGARAGLRARAARGSWPSTAACCPPYAVASDGSAIEVAPAPRKQRRSILAPEVPGQRRSAPASSPRWCATSQRATPRPAATATAADATRRSRNPEDLVLKDDKHKKPKQRKPRNRRHGRPADGHARLDHDGTGPVAFHDLAARPLLGRDRRRVLGALFGVGDLRPDHQRRHDPGPQRHDAHDGARGDPRRADRDGARVRRRHAPRARQGRAALGVSSEPSRSSQPTPRAARRARRADPVARVGARRAGAGPAARRPASARTRSS